MIKQRKNSISINHQRNYKKLKKPEKVMKAISQIPVTGETNILPQQLQAHKGGEMETGGMVTETQLEGPGDHKH